MLVRLAALLRAPAFAHGPDVLGARRAKPAIGQENTEKAREGTEEQIHRQLIFSGSAHRSQSVTSEQRSSFFRSQLALPSQKLKTCQLADRSRPTRALSWSICTFFGAPTYVFQSKSWDMTLRQASQMFSCPHCGEPLHLNDHYPILTKIAAMSVTAHEIDRLRYVVAWVCDRCSYSKILEQSDKSA